MLLCEFGEDSGPSWGVRSSLNPGGGGTGVTGGCTGEVVTCLPCVVLESLKMLNLRSLSHFA